MRVGMTRLVFLGIFFCMYVPALAFQASETGESSNPQDLRSPPLEDLSLLGDLVVMSNGRMKPLATHARETVRSIFGKAPFAGRAALETYASILFQPERWLKQDIFVPGPLLAEELFGRTDVRLSPEQVDQAHSALVGFVQAARGMDSMGRMN
ncbi:MAG: hypothetical protein KJ645_10390, partial [Planctomycetes bacterium]|nr:hypothetical protein [Planctomycetota bacterium]